MIRRFLAAALAMLALAAFQAPAFAAPLPYINSPLDTPQGLVNSAISSINTSTSFPEPAFLQTVTGSGGASTCNGLKCAITTESLTTAAGSVYTETLTNSAITANSIVMVSVGLASATTGTPSVTSVVPAAGSATIAIKNIHASAAFNGTLQVDVLVFN